jgi:VWFA-related protein
MRSRALLLVLALVASLNLAAQVVIDSVTVEVVDVPVFVARGDKPIQGLTRDDFELYVNGKPQPIDYFEAVSAGDEAETLRERRLFLLLIDVAFSEPFALPRAQGAAAQMIAKAGPGDYFAIATYSHRRGVWFATPYTRDREALARAIRSLNSSRSGDPLAIVMTASEREAVSRPGTSGEVAEDTMHDLVHTHAVRAAERQVEALSDLGDRLAVLDGQKHVIYLSEGWDGSSPRMFDAASRTFPAPRPTATSSFAPHLLLRLDEMYRSFHRAGVFFHTLDLEGVAGTLMGNNDLHAFASNTGGRFVHGRNDFGRALTDLSASLDRGYRMGFRPANVRRGYNTIEVRLRNKSRGVRVDHRQGFSTEGMRANVSDGLYLADVVLNDVPQTGTAAALALRDGTLTAQIPMRELAAQGNSAELLIYAFGADGAALMYHREVLAVSGTEEKVFTIAVPEGTAVAKALLRVNGSVGFSRTQ